MTTIRPLRADDRQEWRRLWTRYLEFYETSVGEDVYETTFARLIDPARATQCAFVAEGQSGLVGLVHYLFHPHNWRLEDVCYLQDLFADPSVRGQGVGRKLIEAVYDAADKNDTPVVYWLTQRDNFNAQHLYDRIATLTPFIKYQR